MTKIVKISKRLWKDVFRIKSRNYISYSMDMFGNFRTAISFSLKRTKNYEKCSYLICG